MQIRGYAWDMHVRVYTRDIVCGLSRHCSFSTSLYIFHHIYDIFYSRLRRGRVHSIIVMLYYAAPYPRRCLCFTMPHPTRLHIHTRLFHELQSFIFMPGDPSRDKFCPIYAGLFFCWTIPHGNFLDFPNIATVLLDQIKDR